MGLKGGREIDQVVVTLFGFLVQERGASGPTIMQGRGMFWRYELAHDLILEAVWDLEVPDPFLWLIHYPDAERRLIFDLHNLLERMDVLGAGSRQDNPYQAAEPGPSDAGQRRRAELFEILDPYAQDLKRSYDQVLEYVRSHPSSADNEVKDTSDRNSWGMDREVYWKIMDSGRSVSGPEFTCPSCGYGGRVGVEHRNTPVGSFLNRSGIVLGVLVTISIVGGLITRVWLDHGVWLIPILIALGILSAVCLRLAERTASSLYFCPQCEHEGDDFAPAPIAGA